MIERGSITASCGHKLAPDEESVPVMWEGEDCDAVEGWLPCTFYAEYCPACATDPNAGVTILTAAIEGEQDAGRAH